MICSLLTCDFGCLILIWCLLTLVFVFGNWYFVCFGYLLFCYGLFCIVCVCLVAVLLLDFADFGFCLMFGGIGAFCDSQYQGVGLVLCFAFLSCCLGLI